MSIEIIIIMLKMIEMIFHAILIPTEDILSVDEGLELDEGMFCQLHLYRVYLRGI